MTLRSLFLADGPSDLPLGTHLAALCADAGCAVDVTPVDPRFLRSSDRSVASRVRYLLEQGEAPDLVFVHRDAEGQPPEARRIEIRDGSLSGGLRVPVVPVIPVRMTEAWLLLDEVEIRRVAGRPRGRDPLEIPPLKAVESVADPKQVLLTALLTASGLTGRRRSQFQRDFGRHRALLLQRLDRKGPVTELAAWQQLLMDIDEVLAEVCPERK